MRIAQKLLQQAATNTLLYAPAYHDSGFKRRVIDGDLLALRAHFRSVGGEVALLDRFHKSAEAPGLLAYLDKNPQISNVIVHLWTSDGYGDALARIASDLRDARETSDYKVIAYGPLAAAAAGDLFRENAVDAVVTVTGLLCRPNLPPWPAIETLANFLQLYLTEHPSLRWLTPSEIPRDPLTTYSVAASRGCMARCSFCAYNADTVRWLPRNVDQVVDDMAYLHESVGAVRFALSDNDFGGTRSECMKRAETLRSAMRNTGLETRVTLTVNARPSTLSEGAISALAEAGVRVVLMGVESFSTRTMRTVLAKQYDLEHLLRVTRAMDESGIVPVASYILWHPWQSLVGLRNEMRAIESFGRHRIPQFLTRSMLRVIPGTAIERRIGECGLLRTSPFRREFAFESQDVEAAHRLLSEWYTQNVDPFLASASEANPDHMTALGRLKLLEYQWFKDLLNTTVDNT